MRKFYHGGHIGDVIYSLYTMMVDGGKSLLELGPGQNQRWGDREIKSLLPLINYQSYATGIKVASASPDAHDFTDCTRIVNSRDFYEWHGLRWPGNINLKKRYFIGYFLAMYGMKWVLEHFESEPKWLDAPRTKPYQFVLHLPTQRLCRPISDWYDIVNQLKLLGSVAIIGSDDTDIWENTGVYQRPTDMLDAANYINSAHMFLGSASCNYVIAEGLRKLRFVDVPQESEGTVPTNHSGWNIASWSVQEIINRVKQCI